MDGREGGGREEAGREGAIGGREGIEGDRERERERGRKGVREEGREGRMKGEARAKQGNQLVYPKQYIKTKCTNIMIKNKVVRQTD